MCVRIDRSRTRQFLTCYGDSDDSTARHSAMHALTNNSCCKRMLCRAGAGRIFEKGTAIARARMRKSTSSWLPSNRMSSCSFGVQLRRKCFSFWFANNA